MPNYCAIVALSRSGRNDHHIIQRKAETDEEAKSEFSIFIRRQEMSNPQSRPRIVKFFSAHESEYLHGLRRSDPRVLIDFLKELNAA